MPLLVRAVEIAYTQMSAYYAYVLNRVEITLEEYHTLDACYCALVDAIRACDVQDSKVLDGHLTRGMIARMQEVKEVLDNCQGTEEPDALYR